MLEFATSFHNSVGTEVAGTWFDREEGIWRVSTVPVSSFQSEDEAIEYYRMFCDPETGIPSQRNHMPATLHSLRDAIEAGELCRRKNLDLVKDVTRALSEQREAINRLRDTMARSERAGSGTVRS